VATSPLFSLGGKLRMALDLVLPRRRESGDESLAAFVRRRLGSEALERVADPLVGGIYTADPERLSLAATMPRFLELERRHRSVPPRRPRPPLDAHGRPAQRRSTLRAVRRARRRPGDSRRGGCAAAARGCGPAAHAGRTAGAGRRPLAVGRWRPALRRRRRGG